MNDIDITIERWRIEPQTSADVRTITFLLSTNLSDVKEKLAVILLTGSLMTQVGEYITANQTSVDFELQLGRLAAALLKRELNKNRNLIYSPELKVGYTTDSFPYGSLDIPEISTPQDWTFSV